MTGSAFLLGFVLGICFWWHLSDFCFPYLMFDFVDQGLPFAFFSFPIIQTQRLQKRKPTTNNKLTKQKKDVRFCFVERV